jgi:hypothetical protein
MEWWQIQELAWTATGIVVTLIVVGGLSLRFALKPFLGDLAKLRQGRPDQARSASDLRLDRIEEQLDALGASVERIAEAVDFDRRLKAGGDPAGEPPRG